MEVDTNIVNGLHTTTYKITIEDIISNQMEAYALLFLVISSVMLLYVLWNNFVRSPSKPRGFYQTIKENTISENLFDGLFCDEGTEPSNRVKRISRCLDEYIIIPALALFYIALMYYLSIR